MALVEGTAGVGKTTLIDALVHHHLQQNPYMDTLLRLGQGHTYAPLDPDNHVPQVSPTEQIEYLDRILNMLSFLVHPYGYSSHPRHSCIIETLHFTLSTKPHELSNEQIAKYDGWLAGLGCKLIFIQVTPETHWERCIWERRHNGFITIYAQKYGRTLEEIHAHYVANQAQMLRLFGQSSMPKLLLDGEQPVDTLVETAYDFWVNDIK